MLSKQEQARDKRLRKTYGWSLEQVNKLSEIQGHKCAICGRSFSEFTVVPNVDHLHFHVDLKKSDFPFGAVKWVATVREMPDIVVTGPTQSLVRAAARSQALPRSVRGLLCPGRHQGCNRLLGRVDKPDWLLKAREYLLDPPAKKILKGGSDVRA